MGLDGGFVQCYISFSLQVVGQTLRLFMCVKHLLSVREHSTRSVGSLVLEKALKAFERTISVLLLVYIFFYEMSQRAVLGGDTEARISSEAYWMRNSSDSSLQP